MVPKAPSPEGHDFFTPNKLINPSSGNSDDDTRISTGAPSRRRSADSSVVAEDWVGGSSVRSSQLRTSSRKTTVTWSDLPSVEISQLTWSNRQLEEKLRVAEALLANKEGQVVESQRHLVHLKSQLATLSGTNEHAERVSRRNTELEMLIAKVQQQTDEKLREMTALHTELKGAVSNEQRAANQTAVATAKRLKEAAGSHAEIVLLRNRIKELEVVGVPVSSHHRLELTHLETRLAQGEFSHKNVETKLKREIDLLTDNLNHKIDQLKQLVGTNSHAEALLTRNTHLERALVTGTQEHQQQLNKAKLRADAAEGDRDRLALSLAERKERAAALESEIARLEKDVQRLEASLKSLENVEVEYAEAKASLTTMTISQESLQSRLDLEHAHYEEVLLSRDRQLETFKDVQNHVEMVMVRNKELEQNISEISRQREDELGLMERQILSLRTDLSSRERSLINAQRELDQLRLDNERLSRLANDSVPSAELRAARDAQAVAFDECQRVRETLMDAECALASFKLGAEENRQKFLDHNRRQLEASRQEMEAKIRAEISISMRETENERHKLESGLRKRIGELETELARTVESQSEKMQLAARKRLDEMKTLQQKYEEIIRSSDADKSRQLREYSAKKEEEVENIKRELESNRQRYEADLRKVKVDFENRLRDKSSSLSTEIQALTTRLESAERSKVAAQEEASNALTTDLSVQVLKLRAESQEELRREVEELRRQAVIANDKKENEFNSVLATLEERLRNILAGHAGDIRAIEEAHAKEKSRMSSLYKSSLDSLEAHNQKSLSTTVEHHAIEVAKLRVTIESLETSTSPRGGKTPEIESLKSSLLTSENTRRSLEASITAERRRFSTELQRRDKQVESLVGGSNRLESLMSRNSEIEKLLADKAAEHHAVIQNHENARVELAESLNAQNSVQARRLSSLAASERRLRADLEELQTKRSPAVCGHQCEAAKVERLNLKSTIVRLEEQLQCEKEVEIHRSEEREKQMEQISTTNSQAEKLLSRNETLENQIEALRRLRDLDGNETAEDLILLRAERDAQAKRVQDLLVKFAGDESALQESQSKIRELQVQLAQSDSCDSVNRAVEAELESRVAELVSNKERLETERHALQSQLEMEKGRLTTLAEQRERQLASVKETNAHTESIVRRNTHLELRTDELQQKLADLQRKSEKSVQDAREKWQNDVAAWNEERSRLSKKITEEVSSRFEEEIESTVRVEIDSLNELNSNLQKRVAELNSLVFRLQTELENQAIDDPTLVDAIDRLVELEKLVAQMQDERNKAVEKMQIQIKAVMIQKHDLDTELESIRNSVSEKEKSILTLTEKLERLVREKSDVEMSLVEVRGQLESTVNRIQLEEEDVSLVETLRSLESRNSNLEGLVASLKRTISEQSHTLSGLVERAVEAQCQNGALSQLASDLENAELECCPDPEAVHSVICKTREMQRFSGLTRGGNVPPELRLKLSALEAQVASKELTLEAAKQQQTALISEMGTLRKQLTEKMDLTGAEAWRREMLRINQEEILSIQSRVALLGEQLVGPRSSQHSEPALSTPRAHTGGSVVETTPDNYIVTITPNRDGVTLVTAKRRTTESSIGSPQDSRRLSTPSELPGGAKRHKSGNSQ